MPKGKEHIALHAVVGAEAAGIAYRSDVAVEVLQGFIVVLRMVAGNLGQLEAGIIGHEAWRGRIVDEGTEARLGLVPLLHI